MDLDLEVAKPPFHRLAIGALEFDSEKVRKEFMVLRLQVCEKSPRIAGTAIGEPRERRKTTTSRTEG